jgi:hypothetical protein
MIRSRQALAVSFLLLLFSSTALAQQPAAVSEKDLKLQKQRAQAISMIKQSAAEAPLWDDKKAAVQVLASAADLLWDENPGQGEKWLNKAWELVDQVSDAPKDERLKEYFTGSDRSDLRTEILRVARKHDPKLSDRFLKQLSQKQPEEKKERGAFDARTARSEQLLILALQSVETDPGLAFSLAEASLTDGLSHQLQNVLTGLRKKSVPLSNQLFDLALARFSTSQPDPSEVEVLAGYLFYPGTSFSSNSAGQSIMVMMPSMQSRIAVAPSEPQRTRSFLTAVYQNLLVRPISIETLADKQKAARILFVGDHLAWQYSTYAPDLTPAAAAFLAQLRSRLSPGEDAADSAGTTSRTTTSKESTKKLTKDELDDKYVAELEEAADQESNALFKKMAYVKAALATGHHDFQRGRRIAEKIDDDELRVDTISFLAYRAALLFLSSGIAEKATELLPEISDGPRRAVLKIALAQYLLERSVAPKPESTDLSLTQQKAFDLLNDLDRDLRKEGPSARVAKILLGRAAVLASLDTAQALTALEQAVQVINKTEQFDLLDRSAPNLGLTADPKSVATLETPRIGFGFRSAIQPMITTDFEQVASVVDRLANKEVAGIGRLEAAKLFLQKNPEKPGDKVQPR